MRYKFHYKNLSEFKEEINEYNLDLPLSNDLEVLKNELVLDDKTTIPNRMVIHPMEGCDARLDGSPGDLTTRRYKRYASGGAGLIWFEAVSVNSKGRANQKQLFLHEDNVDKFYDLVRSVREEAKSFTDNHNPYLVLQLTHSGRFGENKSILFHDPNLDKKAGITEDYPVMTDEEIASLEDDYFKTVLLAEKAGFDAVDIKACHRYLLSEMLAAKTRRGKYGGSYENRTRFIKNIIQKIKNHSNINITIRLNIYDAIPDGWGCDYRGNIDLREPKRFVKELVDMGVKVINISASTPYLRPHISRPYDLPSSGGYKPPEHPLIGVNRLITLAREIQETIPEAAVVGTGFSWLRQFAPYVAAGVVENEWAKLIGFGRQAFAYPDFPKDLINKGKFDSSKVCISCSKCAELKSAQVNTGCVIRDKEIYLSKYQNLYKRASNN